jgi:surface protein
MTIASEIQRLQAAKADLKASIEDKGVTVPSVATLDAYSMYVDQISSGGDGSTWTRPSDWLTLPTLTDSDEKVVGLHAIFPESNFCSLKCTGDYTVDWGDGTVENYASGVQAYHQYDYATYDVANATLCSRGYKQAIVTITPQSGRALSAVYLHCKPNQSGLNTPQSGFLDVAIAGADIWDLTIGVQNSGSSMQVVTVHNIEQVKLYSNSITNLSRLFYGCNRLQSVSVFNTSAVTNMSNMFYGCNAIISIPITSASGVTSSTYQSNMYNSCTSLRSISTIGFKYSFSVSGSMLGPTALNTLYTGLATVTGQTITVTNNWGTASDNPAIATAKGWTVTG